MSKWWKITFPAECEASWPSPRWDQTKRGMLCEIIDRLGFFSGMISICWCLDKTTWYFADIIFKFVFQKMFKKLWNIILQCVPGGPNDNELPLLASTKSSPLQWIYVYECVYELQHLFDCILLHCYSIQIFSYISNVLFIFSYLNNLFHLNISG